MKRLLALLLISCLLLVSCGPTVDSTETTTTDSKNDTQTTTVTASDVTTSIHGTTSSATKKPVDQATKTTSPSANRKYDRYEVVNLSDFAGDTDDYTFYTAIDAINMRGAVAAAQGTNIHYTLKIPKREYRFSKTIEMRGLQDVTIDGNGSTFIFTENITAIYMDGCKNVTLTNFNMDYDPLRYTQGIIKAINGVKITVEIDEGYPCDIDMINGKNNTHDNLYGVSESIFHGNVHDPKTGVIKPNTPGNYLFKSDAVSKGGRLVEVSVHSNSIFQGSPADYMQVGDLVSFSYVANKLMWISECLGGLEFININVWGTSGCGMWELNGEGGSLYKNVVVAPGPKPKGATRDRCVVVNGDFLHQNLNKKGPIVDGCTFTYAMDDIINIHGLAYYVLSSNGNKTLIAPRWDYPFKVGDKLKFYDFDSVAAKTGEVTVTSIRSYQDPSKTAQIKKIIANGDHQWGDTSLVYEITTDKALNLDFNDYVTPIGRNCDGAIIKNSTFGKNRSRGIVVKSSDVLIENNTIQNTGFPSITLQMDITFGETGFSSNVIIRNNKIINGTVCTDMITTTNRENLGAIMIGLQCDKGHHGFLNNYEHKNIVIENNYIEGTAVYGISCVNVDGLTVRNNTIKNPFQYGVGKVGYDYGITPNAGIFIGKCMKVKVAGNTVIGGPAQITQAVQVHSNVTGVLENSGNAKK